MGYPLIASTNAETAAHARAPLSAPETQSCAEPEQVMIVAHDLRNYLAPIYTRLQILAKRAQQDGRDQDLHLTLAAERTIEQMNVLIENLLDSARLDHGVFDLRLASFDFVALVRETVELVHTATTPIEVDLPECIRIDGDRERLRQAVHNLLSNAVRHSPNGVPATVRIVAEQRGGCPWTVLTIRDRGNGIPPHVLPRIFDRFVSGPNSRGLGLGLYLARAITSAHGGSLTAHSTPGAGARFDLALPLSYPPSSHEQIEPETIDLRS